MLSQCRYDGPFKSEESILKLKGNVTALKAKQKEVDFQQHVTTSHLASCAASCAAHQLSAGERFSLLHVCSLLQTALVALTPDSLSLNFSGMIELFKYLQNIVTRVICEAS